MYKKLQIIYSFVLLSCAKAQFDTQNKLIASTTEKKQPLEQANANQVEEEAPLPVEIPGNIAGASLTINCVEDKYTDEYSDYLCNFYQNGQIYKQPSQLENIQAIKEDNAIETIAQQENIKTKTSYYYLKDNEITGTNIYIHIQAELRNKIISFNINSKDNKKNKYNTKINIKDVVSTHIDKKIKDNAKEEITTLLEVTPEPLLTQNSTPTISKVVSPTPISDSGEEKTVGTPIPVSTVAIPSVSNNDDNDDIINYKIDNKLCEIKEIFSNTPNNKMCSNNEVITNFDDTQYTCCRFNKIDNKVDAKKVQSEMLDLGDLKELKNQVNHNFIKIIELFKTRKTKKNETENCILDEKITPASAIIKNNIVKCKEQVTTENLVTSNIVDAKYENKLYKCPINSFFIGWREDGTEKIPTCSYFITPSRVLNPITVSNNSKDKIVETQIPVPTVAVIPSLSNNDDNDDIINYEIDYDLKSCKIEDISSNIPNNKMCSNNEVITSFNNTQYTCCPFNKIDNNVDAKKAQSKMLDLGDLKALKKQVNDNFIKIIGLLKARKNETENCILDEKITPANAIIKNNIVTCKEKSTTEDLVTSNIVNAKYENNLYKCPINSFFIGWRDEEKEKIPTCSYFIKTIKN